MKHQPRKRFGQNFLQNQAIIAQILTAVQLKPNHNVVEIGPGLGALTASILSILPHLTAIEIDRDLIADLKTRYASFENFTLIEADALTVDYDTFGPNLRIIGNLPYNIATPLMLYLLSFTGVMDMHFMLQKEVASRLAAPVGTKAYGRLSVIMQVHCEVELLFDVPREAFLPEPKVNSTVVRLTPHRQSPFPSVKITELEDLVAKAFSMRRKTLANNLKPVFSAGLLTELGIDPNLRPEQISVMDYVKLTRACSRS